MSNVQLLAVTYCIVMALLLVLWYYEHKQAARPYDVTYVARVKYPLELYAKLYERAKAAAAAWVDDIPEDNYLGLQRAKFFVRQKLICVRVYSSTGNYVDVFFEQLKSKEWQRAQIRYKGERVR